MSHICDFFSAARSSTASAPSATQALSDYENGKFLTHSKLELSGAHTLNDATRKCLNASHILTLIE